MRIEVARSERRLMAHTEDGFVHALISLPVLSWARFGHFSGF